MGTISDKLKYLNDTKTAIKNAIVAKGVEVGDTDTFRSYADKISSIQSGGGGETAKIDANGFRFGGSTFSEFDPSPFDFSNVTNYLEMFKNCTEMKSIDLFDTSKAIIMQSIFQGCKKLQNIPLFNTSSVNNMYNMFYGCQNLQTIPLIDTSKSTTLRCMFYGCQNLQTIPKIDTSKATDMSYMFYHCSQLQTIPQLVTSKATDMSYMFHRCSQLQTIPQLDTSNVTDMSYMFHNDTSLSSLPLMNLSRCVRNNSMLNLCGNLTTIEGFTGLQTSFALNQCPLLTVESVMNVINHAQDMSAQPRTLTLHADVFAKLTEEQIATANAKGWNIAS